MFMIYGWIKLIMVFILRKFGEKYDRKGVTWGEFTSKWQVTTWQNVPAVLSTWTTLILLVIRRLFVSHFFFFWRIFCEFSRAFGNLIENCNFTWFVSTKLRQKFRIFLWWKGDPRLNYTQSLDVAFVIAPRASWHDLANWWAPSPNWRDPLQNDETPWTPCLQVVPVPPNFTEGALQLRGGSP